ncbi:hypothetical protein BGW41_006889 [Actinomortierella wolfii]|nr:hypothetical protein BGW41_006889 [Actinomortierella wolfii]
MRQFRVDPMPLPLTPQAPNTDNNGRIKNQLSSRGAAGRPPTVGLKTSGTVGQSNPLKSDRNNVFHVRPIKADSITTPPRKGRTHSVFLPPARPRLGQSPKGAHFKTALKSQTPRPLLGLPHFITRSVTPSSSITSDSSILSSKPTPKQTTPKRGQSQSSRESRLSLSDLSLPSSPALSASSTSSDELPQIKFTQVEKPLDQLEKYRPELEPIKTYLRLRPLSADQISANHGYVELVNDTDILMRPPPNATRQRSKEPSKYKFTKVFGQTTTQDAVFEQVGLPLLIPVLRQDHYNTLLFAYGVSNSGKTFTVLGTEEHPGILPHTLSVIFKSIEAVSSDSDEAAQYRPIGFQDIEACEPSSIAGLPGDLIDETVSTWDESHLQSTHVVDLPPGMDFAVWMSIAEIYTEKIYDLLAEQTNTTSSSNCSPGATGITVDMLGRQEMRRPTLSLKTDPSSSHKYIHGLREIRVRNIQEAMAVVRAGLRQRQVFSTMLNQSSSRSHCIFTIKIIKVPQVGLSAEDEARKGRTSVSRISIVDLAGSERVRNTNNTGQRLKEAGNINNSLMVLGQCMEVLRLNQTRRGKTQQLVPFRHSKLTELFQSTLEGGSHERSNCQAAMIVNVNPFETSFDENTHVMKFSSVAMNVATLRQPGSRETGNFVRRVAPIKKAHGSSSTSALSSSQASMTTNEDEEGDAKVRDEDEEEDPQVTFLLNQVEDLREKWLEAENRCSTIESEIREEMAEEMERRLQRMEAFFQSRLHDEASMNETKIGRKIDLITRAKSSEEAVVVQGLQRKIQQLEELAQNRLLEIEGAHRALAEVEQRYQEQGKVVESLEQQLSQWSLWFQAAPSAVLSTPNTAIQQREIAQRESANVSSTDKHSPMENSDIDATSTPAPTTNDQKHALNESLDSAEQEQAGESLSIEDQIHTNRTKNSTSVISLTESRQWQNKNAEAQETAEDISATVPNSIHSMPNAMGNAMSTRAPVDVTHLPDITAVDVSSNIEESMDVSETIPDSPMVVEQEPVLPSNTTAEATEISAPDMLPSHSATSSTDARPASKKIRLEGGVPSSCQWEDEEELEERDDASDKEDRFGMSCPETSGQRNLEDNRLYSPKVDGRQFSASPADASLEPSAASGDPQLSQPILPITGMAETHDQSKEPHAKRSTDSMPQGDFSAQITSEATSPVVCTSITEALAPERSLSPQEPASRGPNVSKSSPEPGIEKEVNHEDEDKEELQTHDDSTRVGRQEDMTKSRIKIEAKSPMKAVSSVSTQLDVTIIESSNETTPEPNNSSTITATSALQLPSSARSGEDSELEDVCPSLPKSTFDHRLSFLLRDIPESERRSPSMSPTTGSAGRSLYPKLSSPTPEPEVQELKGKEVDRRRSTGTSANARRMSLATQSARRRSITPIDRTRSLTEPISSQTQNMSHDSHWGEVEHQQDTEPEQQQLPKRMEDGDRMSLRSSSSYRAPSVSRHSIEIEIPVRRHSFLIKKEPDDENRLIDESGQQQEQLQLPVQLEDSFRRLSIPPRDDPDVADVADLPPSPRRQSSVHLSSPSPKHDMELEQEDQQDERRASESRRSSNRRISSNTYALYNMMEQLERRASVSSTVSSASNDSEQRTTAGVSVADPHNEDGSSHAVEAAEGSHDGDAATSAAAAAAAREIGEEAPTKKRKRKLRAKKAVFEEEMSETVRASSPPMPTGTKLARRRFGRKPLH